MACDSCMSSDNVTQIVVSGPKQGWSMSYELCGDCTAKIRDIGMFAFSLEGLSHAFNG